MFEKICIHPCQSEGTEYDLGLVTESLLFYGRVYLVVAPNSIEGLLRQFPQDQLLELVEAEQLFLVYGPEPIGVWNHDCDLGIVTSDQLARDQAVPQSCLKVLGKSRQTDRFISQLLNIMTTVEYPQNLLREIRHDTWQKNCLGDFLRRQISVLGIYRGFDDASPNSPEGGSGSLHRLSGIPV